jgi:hypothetical protein
MQKRIGYSSAYFLYGHRRFLIRTIIGNDDFINGAGLMGQPI